MGGNKIIEVNGIQISLTTKSNQDYICLTDMAGAFDGGSGLIENWLRNKNTVEFLGIWEKMHNPDFNSVEFDGIMMQVGLNRFKLSVKKWTSLTQAIGITSKAGKYGGTYAHIDIAYHFGMWLSPEFYLLVVSEFQRLKDEESKQIKSAEWMYRRFLIKANYALQTDAVKTFILPNTSLPREKQGLLYANEAELINYAVLGYTSKEWSNKNKALVLKGENLRDNLGIEELMILDSMQTLNSHLISQNIEQSDRFKILRAEAERQMQILKSSKTIANIK